MRLIPSADGTTARIHVAGRRLSAPEFAALVESAASRGDGDLHITSRGNIQIRGLDGAPHELGRVDDEAAGSVDTRAELGWLERADGLVDLGGAVAFGVIRAKVAQLLTVLEAEVSVTPRRTFLLHGLEPHVAEAAVRVLAPMGASFDAATDLVRISACIGAPACRHGLTDVRQDAFRADTPGRVHFVGCAKACGRPKEPHTEFLATGEGEYEVTQRGM